MSKQVAQRSLFDTHPSSAPFFTPKGKDTFWGGTSTAQAFFAPTPDRVVQKAPTPATYKNETDIKALTLSDFYTYTHAHADWAIRTPPGDLSPATRINLRKIQEFAETKRTLDACGSMTINDILTAGVTDATFKDLGKYKQGYTQEQPTVELNDTPDVKKAIEWGKAIAKLETVLTGSVLSVTMKEKDGEFKDQLSRLINKKRIDELIAYLKDCQASIEANNGRDFESYIKMRDESVDPRTYKGKLAHVKNFHRFEPDALDKLVDNESKGNPPSVSRGWFKKKAKKPFVLILHSGLDHNGAFHRDPFLTEVIKHTKNFTLMVEGASSIKEISDLIAPMAAQYGEGGKINQVMLAGHGNSKSMQLAGTVGTDARDGEVETDTKCVTAYNKDAESQELMNKLFENMANDANSRIVLNACLTASDSVPGELDPDPAKAKKQINDAINNNPSLATKFKQIAADNKSKVTVAGANGSFGQIQLIDPKTGRLDLIPPKGTDPALTSDPLEYVRTGTEPTGVLRATVKCWAEDEAKCLKAVEEHHKNAPAAFDGTLIKSMFGIILKNKNDGRLMNQLSHATDTLAEFWRDNEINDVDYLMEVRSLIDAHINTIYKDILPILKDRKKMLIYQEWMHNDKTKDSDFLAALDKDTAIGMQRFVNITSISSDLSRLLPIPAAAPNKDAKIKLAAIGVMKGNNNAGDPSYEFLHSLVVNRKFPAALNIATLTGFSDQTLLESIGISEDISLPKPGKKGKKAKPSKPTPNIDLNGDGKHDFYINAYAGGAFVTAKALNVRRKPGTSYDIISTLKQNAVVTVIGDSGNWYAIQFGSRVGFISKKYSLLKPVS
ncbi:MAG: SH3 domain-containing protein [Chitinophagales bacterium]|nr:SH3 domain-containing protein [Chitinophagales bacterium]